MPAKVTINEGRTEPTHEPEAVPDVVEVDGRRIRLRELDANADIDMALALGDLSGNEGLQNIYLLQASIAEIDGDPVMTPGSVIEMRALGARLGNRAKSAISSALAKRMAAQGTEVLTETVRK